jgi:hypothetical protein
MTNESTTANSDQPVAKLVLLHPADNILVCVSPITCGERLLIDDTFIISVQPVDVGHKVARRALSSGEKIIKYGAPIGSMSESAECGAHVHMHNMRSDYIPSHTRTRQNKDRSEN